LQYAGISGISAFAGMSSSHLLLMKTDGGLFAPYAAPKGTIGFFLSRSSVEANVSV
jgi:hypothetical protein